MIIELYLRQNSLYSDSIGISLPKDYNKEGYIYLLKQEKERGTHYDRGRKVSTWPISFQDDASRMMVHGELFEHDNANNVQLCFKKAIGKAGKPKRTYLDYSEEKTMP